MSKFFSYPTPIPAKIWRCSLWSRSVILGSAESEMVRLISREIIFLQNSNFQPIWSRYLNVTDRQTGRQLALAIPRSARLHAVKTVESYDRAIFTIQ